MPRAAPARCVTTNALAIRPATTDDLDWLRGLAAAESVEPFLSPEAPARVEEAVERGEMLVAEAPPGTRAGAVRVVVTAPRSRIAALRTLIIDPAARGHGLGTAMIRALAHRLLVDGDLHRLEADVYGFNAAGRRTFEAAGSRSRASAAAPTTAMATGTTASSWASSPRT